jgi:channel protein (hemolysin III family)
MMLGKMRNPVRGFMDATAAVVSLVALVVLIALTTHNIPRMLSMIVYSLSLIALYTTSSLYHTIPWKPPWHQRMQRVDHSMIFVLVAGSFTPVAFNVLDGAWRVSVLTVVWQSPSLASSRRSCGRRCVLGSPSHSRPAWGGLRSCRSSSWFAASQGVR